MRMSEEQHQKIAEIARRSSVRQMVALDRLLDEALSGIKEVAPRGDVAGTQPIHVSFPAERRAELEKLARANRWSLSRTVRELVNHALS